MIVCSSSDRDVEIGRAGHHRYARPTMPRPRLHPITPRRPVTLSPVDAKQQVLEAAEERASALAAGDARRLSAVLHDDFRWTSHLGDTFNRSDYIRRNTHGETTWRSQELSRVEVVVVGETAVLYAEVIDVVLDDAAQPDTFRMPMTQVWVRCDSTWRCLAGHAGPRLA